MYGLDRLLALWDAQTPDDQQRFCFDPRVIDWDDYVRNVHLPSVVEHGRVRTTPGGRVGPDRETRLRRQVLSPDRQLAAFDLENTLIASNVVASYSWLATRRLPADERLRFVARTLAEAPSLLALDRKDRSDFLRLFYRRYEHAPIAQIDEDSAEMFSQLILAKSFPAAIRRVREHRRLGHRTLLITGALDFVVDPLRPLFDDIVCASLGQRADGTYDGELAQVPPTGETRAQAHDGLRRRQRPRPPRVGGLRRLHERPADARGRRLPRGGQPRDRGWPPWPASAAGWSSTGPSRRERRACWFRSGRGTMRQQRSPRASRDGAR